MNDAVMVTETAALKICGDDVGFKLLDIVEEEFRLRKLGV